MHIQNCTNNDTGNMLMGMCCRCLHGYGVFQVPVRCQARRLCINKWWVCSFEVCGHPHGS